MVIHEIGHGITTKHFGREVRAAGIGWYWFSPIAFVDTTDMWTAGRWPRIAVSLAGPYANFILAGIASYIAWFSTSSVVSSALWQFALVSYISVLLNLHPLLEFDGYYILSDLLDRPNLRQRAIEWFGRFIRGDVDRRVELPRHRFDFSYSVSSIIYIIVIAFIFIISYRIVLESFFRSFLPDTIALVLPWIVISLIIISAVVTILSDMRILKQR
jgi:putative peptide zinc metalloprotease protein